MCIIGEQRRINRTANAQLEPIAVTSQSSLIDVVVLFVVVVVALVVARITCKIKKIKTISIQLHDPRVSNSGCAQHTVGCVCLCVCCNFERLLRDGAQVSCCAQADDLLPFCIYTHTHTYSSYIH